MLLPASYGIPASFSLTLVGNVGSSPEISINTFSNLYRYYEITLDSKSKIWSLYQDTGMRGQPVKKDHIVNKCVNLKMSQVYPFSQIPAQV